MNSKQNYILIQYRIILKSISLQLYEINEIV